MSVLAEAKSKIPGYSEKDLQRDRAKRLMKELQATGWKRNFQIASANLAAALQESMELDEIRAALAAREAARADFFAFNEIESSLQQQVSAPRGKIDAPPESEVAPALQWLNTQMSELMSFVRDLDRGLGDVSSIEEALRDDDVVKLWRDIEDAADRYEEIRQAQEIICRLPAELEGPQLSALLNGVGRLRNGFDMETVWTRERKPRTPAQRGTYDRAYLDWLEAPPVPKYDWDTVGDRNIPVWPYAAHSSLDPREPRYAPRIEVLRWLAKHKAAWVPTFDEMHATANDIRFMLAPLNTIAQTRAALHAFRRYYTDRGVKPVTPFDVQTALESLPAERGQRDNRDRDGRMHTDPRILAALGEAP